MADVPWTHLFGADSSRYSSQSGIQPVAKQVIEYLKANPEAAQQSYEQAHRMLRTPGMAQMMLDSKVQSANIKHETLRSRYAMTLKQASCLKVP